MSAWRDSDLSDDEYRQDTRTSSFQCGIACDQCRKTKSKCERQVVGQCKGCSTSGLSDHLQGPSYKRGPPKGYIQAIEQRWQQVESLLGVIIACPDPRIQAVVSELRKDDLAREIISRVDSGPFGPSGRSSRADGATKEEFFAAVLRGGNPAASHEPQNVRSRRQSRVSREIVSSARDTSLSVVPSVEWQNRLSERLATAPVSAVHASTGSDSGCNSACTCDVTNSPLNQLDTPSSTEQAVHAQPDWGSMYTIEEHSGEWFNLCIGGRTKPKSFLWMRINRFNCISFSFCVALNPPFQVHFHGKASGLHLLGKTDRTDTCREGGIWHLSMSQISPSASVQLVDKFKNEESEVDLPPLAIQERLLDLYFTFVHPTFPVVNKDSFTTEYNRSYRLSSVGAMISLPVTAESARSVSKLLLLSMFAIAARYAKDKPIACKGTPWEAGSQYVEQARQLLTKVFHQSRPSTCQSLLLLGYREFGIGPFEQGWIYIGTAIRMALDLGLNRNSDKWQLHGTEIFSAEEKQARQQIWWACCIADKYSSVSMGRPIAIREDDHDTNLPNTIENEAKVEGWHAPAGSDALKPISFHSMQLLSCFRASASLSVIVGLIATNVYPVRASNHTARCQVLADLERRLDRWFIELPDSLHYDPGKAVAPPPSILFLHVSYWGAVLLLNRAFIPKRNGHQLDCKRTRTGGDTDVTSMRAFDLCQSAANHITSIIDANLEKLGVDHCSPLLSSFILSAGIMHVVTLTLRPPDVEAAQGLHQCLGALKVIETIWPSASRAWKLLNGVKIRLNNAWSPSEPGSGRPKRSAEEAFGRNNAFLPAEAHSPSFERNESVPAGTNGGQQDYNAQMVAQTLGLDVSNIGPSPGQAMIHDWWPRADTITAVPSQAGSPEVTSPLDLTFSASSSLAFDAPRLVEDWIPCSSDPRLNYEFNSAIATTYSM